MLSVHLLGGLMLGWGLGANDAANVFGTAVSSRMLRFGTAALLCAVFVVIGAVTGGLRGIETLGALSTQSLATATYTAVGGGLSIAVMTLLRIPASTSQAVVGAIIGVGLMAGSLNLAGLPKVVICWLGTPIGALLVAVVLYRTLGGVLNRVPRAPFARDVYLRWALMLAGCYGAYALGANNVANVTAVYHAAGALTARQAALFGGLSIALGVLTFSRRVMLAVGRGITPLDPFSAFVVVLAEAITVHAYAWIGVPVSTSQAVVGAVVGVGLTKHASAVRGSALLRIGLGWVATPLIAALLSVLLFFLSHLRYVSPALGGP